MAVKWKTDAVVNVKLKGDLYTIAQMYQHPYVQFFQASNKTGNWEELCLNRVPKFMFLPHDKFFAKEHYVEKLKKIKPIEIIPPQYAITTFPRLSLVEPTFRDDGIYDSYNAAVIKDGLDPVADEEVIRSHELINMELSWNLKTRLIYFFETGVDINLSKLRLFYPAEFIKYLKIFNERFEVPDSENSVKMWENYLDNRKAETK